MLTVCSWMGLIWELQPVPERIYERLETAVKIERPPRRITIFPLRRRASAE
jgi:hypothetical protein